MITRKSIHVVLKEFISISTVNLWSCLGEPCKFAWPPSVLCAQWCGSLGLTLPDLLRSQNPLYHSLSDNRPGQESAAFHSISQGWLFLMAPPNSSPKNCTVHQYSWVETWSGLPKIILLAKQGQYLSWSSQLPQALLQGTLLPLYSHDPSHITLNTTCLSLGHLANVLIF